MADRIRGRKLRFTWTEGPTKGETHEHAFHDDGSVEYVRLERGKPVGTPTREKRYGSERITDDVYVVSYLGAAGFTLTTVLDFARSSIVAFASNDKSWFPCKGTLEAVP